MIFIDKNKADKLFYIILTIFHLIFFSTIFLTDGYPHNNDILYIFKVASLEGNLKFINGLYGPGYVYYSLVFSNSVTILSFVICLLIIFSSILLSILLNNFTKNTDLNEKFTIYLFSLLFHLIIIFSLGFNHSESIFLLLFYNGFLIFIFGYYFKNNTFVYFTGLILLGISILFRQHAIVVLFFLYIFFLIFEINYCKKNFYLFFKRYFIIGFILFTPVALALIHLLSIDAIRMWQTSFRLHMIFYVDLWGDWRDLKYLLETEDIKNFNLFKVEAERIWIEFRNFSLHALKILYPFIICFLISFSISKKQIILIALSFFILFILIIIPGFHKGYIPALLFCFISVLLCFKQLSNKKIMSFFMIVFLFGHLFYLIERYTENIIYSYKVNKDIKNNIVPYLNKNKLKYRNIFSDHLSFYTTKIDGDIDKLCTWGGWFLLHPYLKDYYPRDVILGKKNKYCDVKILITREKNFAEEYMAKENINFKFKTDLHYILTVN